MNDNNEKTPSLDLDALDQVQPDVRIGFILTREGRVWSEQAMLDLTDRYYAKYPPKPGKEDASGILWQCGWEINDPALLAGILAKRPDAVIVLSMPESSVILDTSLDAKHTIQEYLDLHKDSGMTSWAILSGAYVSAHQQG